MGQITTKETYGIISSEDVPEISYCPRCKKQGWDSILKGRVYLPGESIPSERDLWQQCHDCGQLVPIYQVKKERKLLDFVETSSNPFDQGKSIIGLDNKATIKQRKLHFKKE
jgi:hypothetical protein